MDEKSQELLLSACFFMTLSCTILVLAVCFLAKELFTFVLVTFENPRTERISFVQNLTDQSYSIFNMCEVYDFKGMQGIT